MEVVPGSGSEVLAGDGEEEGDVLDWLVVAMRQCAASVGRVWDGDEGVVGDGQA